MNRDHFTTPAQGGGRTQHDYGHTHIPTERTGVIVRPWMLVVSLFLWVAIGCGLEKLLTLAGY